MEMSFAFFYPARRCSADSSLKFRESNDFFSSAETSLTPDASVGKGIISGSASLKAGLFSKNADIPT